MHVGQVPMYKMNPCGAKVYQYTMYVEYANSINKVPKHSCYIHREIVYVVGYLACGLHPSSNMHFIPTGDAYNC